MSRLRRPSLYDRYIFVTVDLLRSRRKLEERGYARLAIALARMQQKQVDTSAECRFSETLRLAHVQWGV